MPSRDSYTQCLESKKYDCGGGRQCNMSIGEMFILPPPRMLSFFGRLSFIDHPDSLFWVMACRQIVLRAVAATIRRCYCQRNILHRTWQRNLSRQRERERERVEAALGFICHKNHGLSVTPPLSTPQGRCRQFCKHCRQSWSHKCSYRR